MTGNPSISDNDNDSVSGVKSMAANNKPGVPPAPSDPHPSDEEHYDRIPHPGGAKPLGKDIGPNPAVHDGSRPTGPQSGRDEQ